MLRSSINEFVVEGYQVGMWMKRNAERLDREKEASKEKERRCRENEREDKEKSRKKEIEKKKSFFEKSWVQIMEEFEKEMKSIERNLRERQKIKEKGKDEFECAVEEKVKQEIEVPIDKKVVGDVSPQEVSYNVLPKMKLGPLVDLIPSAPLLTRPSFEIEVKKKQIEEEKKKETCEEKVERKGESILFIEDKVNLELWPRQFQPIFLSKDAYSITNSFSLHSGANSNFKPHVLMIPRKVSRGFQRIMFDPGG